MAKVKIDKLDLKKRRAEMDRGQLQRQVPIRVSQPVLRQPEEVTQDYWAEPVPQMEEPGPGEITSQSFLEKVGKKFGKKKRPAPMMDDYGPSVPPQRAVPIRSAEPERYAEPEEVALPPRSYNLSQRQSRGVRRPIEPITTTKTFQERIAEKTSQRIRAERGEQEFLHRKGRNR